MTPDEQLLDDLRRVLDAVETPPPVSVALAEAALGWRDLDIELAELVHDSTVDGSEALVRGDAHERRVLSFSSGRAHIEVEYADGRLVGQVVPAEVVEVQLYRGSGIRSTVTTDEFGTFAIADVAPGPLALVCRAGDGTWSVRTSWTAV